MYLNFVKMHGLGNDFIISKKSELPTPIDQSLIKKLCDRYTGIGCDQFILYEKLQPTHYNMIIYNSDGSNATLCGNATRCLALLIHQQTKLTSFAIQSTTKLLNCTINNSSITVNIGPANFTSPWMPPIEKLLDVVRPYAESLNNIILVDVGNPHAIIYGKFTAENKLKIGKLFQSKDLFENGINVGFAEILNNTINLTTWERGVGPTKACGSNACASFVASLKQNLIASPAEVQFSIGKLTIDNDNGNILMTGPATLVAKGKFYY